MYNVKVSKGADSDKLIITIPKKVAYEILSRGNDELIIKKGDAKNIITQEELDSDWVLIHETETTKVYSIAKPVVAKKMAKKTETVKSTGEKLNPELFKQFSGDNNTPIITAVGDAEVEEKEEAIPIPRHVLKAKKKISYPSEEKPLFEA